MPDEGRVSSVVITKARKRRQRRERWRARHVAAIKQWLHGRSDV